MRGRVRAILAAVLLALCAGPAAAEDPKDQKPALAGRRDLAIHLERLEEAIRAKRPAFEAKRHDVAVLVAKATVAFFAMNGNAAVDALGEALALLEGRPWDADEANLARMRLVLPAVVVRGADGKATVVPRLEALGTAPGPSLRRVREADWAPSATPADPTTAPAFADLERTPLPAWDVPAGARGRQTLTVTFRGADRASKVVGETYVVEADVPARLAKAKATLASIREAPALTPPGVRPTLERLAARVQGALKGEVGDVLPDVSQELLRLERGAEGLAAAAQASHPYRPARADLEGDSHRATSRGRAYRLYVPGPGSRRPPVPPLVVALHGAGGGEDMYFEAYGAGEAVRQAETRGWLLVSPDDPKDASEVVEDVQTLLAVDAKRLYLTGHSMGAGTAWSLAVARPELWAAVAPVAGGWMSFTQPSWTAAQTLPILSVTGDLDFARPATERTAAQAKAAGVPIEARTVVDLDHLLLVGETLPAVFAFFDAHVKP